MLNKVWHEISYQFPNFSGVTINVWEWISYFISHFVMDVITDPCWDLIYPIAVKGTPVCQECGISSRLEMSF